VRASRRFACCFPTTATAIVESNASRLTYPRDRWEALVKWARFPQAGLARQYRRRRADSSGPVAGADSTPPEVK
jgi:hypothetical protein